MVFVAASNDYAKLNRLSELNWFYLGNHRGLERAVRILSKAKRKFIGRDIESIVDSVRDNFVDYIGRLSRQQKDKIIWYSSPMASKSMSQTSMFHQYVYQKLLEKLAYEEDKDILVVTDSDELLGNANKIKLKQVKVLSNHIFYKKQIYDRIKGCLRILRYFLIWCICNLP